MLPRAISLTFLKPFLEFGSVPLRSCEYLVRLKCGKVTHELSDVDFKGEHLDKWMCLGYLVTILSY